MKMSKALTQEQKARIHCVKHGHATYVYQFFGYVHCGRCGDQIGDTLGSIFPMDKRLVIGCKDSPCNKCDPIKESLSKMDKKILKRLEKMHASEKSLNHEKAWKGVVFDEQ